MVAAGAAAPEHVAGDATGVPVTVEHAVFQGPVVRCTLRRAGRHPDRRPRRPGAAAAPRCSPGLGLRVDWDYEAARLLPPTEGPTEAAADEEPDLRHTVERATTGTPLSTTHFPSPLPAGVPDEPTSPTPATPSCTSFSARRSPAADSFDVGALGRGRTGPGEQPAAACGGAKEVRARAAPLAAATATSRARRYASPSCCSTSTSRRCRISRRPQASRPKIPRRLPQGEFFAKIDGRQAEPEASIVTSSC